MLELTGKMAESCHRRESVSGQGTHPALQRINCVTQIRVERSSTLTWKMGVFSIERLAEDLMR